VFLLLLCNDKAVLGPWINSKRLNAFTGSVVAILVVLSIILTAATVFPDITGGAIVEILIGGLGLFAVGYLATLFAQRRLAKPVANPVAQGQHDAAVGNGDAHPERDSWRMPPLDELPPPKLTLSTRVWMASLRVYLVIAVGLVVVKVVQLAVH
jgi:hypothetical protein